MYPGLTVFDLDHTLLKVNSSYRFGLFLYKKRCLSFIALIFALLYYARHKLLGLSLQDLHQKIFMHIFKGLSQKRIQDYVKEFLREELDQLLYFPLIQRLSEARQRGEYILLLSSSPDFLVIPIASYLNIDHCQGSVYVTDEQGYFNDITKIIDGRYKADYVKELAKNLGIANSFITVYSDSYLDLPVLKIAGKAIGVFPDSLLYQTCRINGWEIINR